MSSNQTPIIIEQTLHGYSAGHQTLASSENLDRKIQMTLLEMSDSPGSGFGIDGRSCLTGYPLDSIGKYALARTWDAKEMPRPGCVWTHTLLINMADLPRIKNLASLDTLFQRPKNQQYSSYKQPINLNTDTFAYETDNSAYENALIELIYQLYSSSNSIYLPRENFDEKLLYIVWAQQWPKLRRSFKFRSWFPKASTKSNVHFDIILHTSLSNNHQQEHLHSTEVSWLKSAVNDALMEKGSSLREFYWKYGADSLDTRAAFIPLTEAWEITQRKPLETEELSSHLLNWPNRPLSLVRKLARDISSNALSELKQETAELLLANLSNLRDNELSLNGEILIGKSVGQESIERINTVMNIAPKHKEGILKGALQVMSSEAVMKLLNDDPDLLFEVIPQRHDILEEIEFWNENKLTNLLLENTGEISPELIITSAIRSNSTENIEKIVSKFGQLATDYIINELHLNAINSLWLKEASKYPLFLFNSMEKQNSWSIRNLTALSQSISPFEIDQHRDTDVWIEALKNCEPEPLSYKLTIFLMKRGLAGKSPESTKLIELSFDPFIQLLLNNNISWTDWNSVEKLIDPSFSFFPQNKTQKFISGLCKIIKLRKISSKEVSKFSKIKENLNLILAEVSKHK